MAIGRTRRGRIGCPRGGPRTRIDDSERRLGATTRIDDPPPPLNASPRPGARADSAPYCGALAAIRGTPGRNKRPGVKADRDPYCGAMTAIRGTRFRVPERVRDRLSRCNRAPLRRNEAPHCGAMNAFPSPGAGRRPGNAERAKAEGLGEGHGPRGSGGAGDSE